MALHEQSVGKTDEWYTPPYIFDAMKIAFDSDVASPGREIVPWIPALLHITERSLEKKWEGFIWMNPPFGGRNGIIPWLDKFCSHGNGVCLAPDRTSAPWWQRFVPMMNAILFVSPKIKFIDSSGMAGKSPAQGTCLMSIGVQGLTALKNAQTLGKLLRIL